MNRHWTIDELVDRLYGLREADEHLGSCGECIENLRDLECRRAAVIKTPPLPSGWFQAQRDAVLERIDAPPRLMLRWVPALTAACLLAIGVVAYRPMHAPPPRTESSDAQLFADIYNIEESAEPRAAAPMHELFQEENQ